MAEELAGNPLRRRALQFERLLVSAMNPRLAHNN